MDVSKTILNNNNNINKVRTFESDKTKVNDKIIPVNNKIIYEEIFTKNDNVNSLAATNLELHKRHLRSLEDMENMKKDGAKRVRRGTKKDPRCELFAFNEKEQSIIHPHPTNISNANYYGSIDCDVVIQGNEGQVVELTFVDIFRIEYHPQCSYDYLEIRDGLYGYAKLIDKVCGQTFPRQMTSSGPYVWLKFKADDTIEYEGFKIHVAFKTAPSHKIPDSCYIPLSGSYGWVESANIDQACLTGSANQALDVLWKIVTNDNSKIYLNFSTFTLAKPNECEENLIQVFGAVLELDAILIQYCGSMANLVSTKDSPNHDEPSNVMHVRLFEARTARENSKEKTSINASYTAYRTLNPNSDDTCNIEKEFDCQDNTCIDIALKCNRYANCRLKADEDVELCKGVEESILKQAHILVILVIFSLILSGMTFVFLFKCIMKLYHDHKIIKEHIRQSCEDRLDSLVGRRLTLDAQRLQSDSEPRVSLERENHTNEMFKQQRKFSKHQPSSIDSDYIQETHLDVDEESWRREVESIQIDPEDIRIERNGRTRRSDLSKKEESIRSKRKESQESREKKEIRDVSVGAPDTKESGCQTRESLFQTEPPPSSDGSGSNSRGFSTFGYSGATIARHSPPAATNTSEIHIELLRQVPKQESMKPQKKLPERRPISTETTRSAPDVIIVSKPIR
ncbi:hypothetical protein K1T71_012891 [Dendrolimus kikuchii]|uniref:Uncharacterized protein n=1 Tax=Dendrolimus kikuchii TaxID=765133 RepID=A0ACC1CIE1_9NEOP|nr:hypothetical protein K1T71_012891 [Dendrolimus kikuchii]